MPNKPKDDSVKPASPELVKASYNAGLATGRIQAIEESMDVVAGLIFKAEAMIGELGENADKALRDSADHTLRGLQIAFAAITGSTNGSAAFRELLEQSRQRAQKKAASMH